MEQKTEQPQPREGDEATIGTMSPLAIVRQYLSTSSAKKAPSCVIVVGCQGNLVQIAY